MYPGGIIWALEVGGRGYIIWGGGILFGQNFQNSKNPPKRHIFYIISAFCTFSTLYFRLMLPKIFWYQSFSPKSIVFGRKLSFFLFCSISLSEVCYLEGILFGVFNFPPVPGGWVQGWSPPPPAGWVGEYRII